MNSKSINKGFGTVSRLLRLFYTQIQVVLLSAFLKSSTETDMDPSEEKTENPNFKFFFLFF